MRKGIVSNEDTFFISVLATWLSVRINEWGTGNITHFFILIIAIFAYSLLIGEVRHTISLKLNPSQYDIEAIHRSTILIAALIILLVIVFCYFLWGDENYLESKDKYVFCGVGIIWGTLLVYEYLTEKKCINSVSDISKSA